MKMLGDRYGISSIYQSVSLSRIFVHRGRIGYRHVCAIEMAHVCGVYARGYPTLAEVEVKLIKSNLSRTLVDSLEGHIYYNPLVENYEIADRFIAGNVVKKAEDIQAWIDKENDRIKGFPGYDGIEPYIEMAQDSLKALQDATPRKITFDELDFNVAVLILAYGLLNVRHGVMQGVFQQVHAGNL